MVTLQDPGTTVRTERVAATLGIALGVMFTICFLTGVLSHLIQDPPSWFTWPARPAGTYRVTQGLHIATGIAGVSAGPTTRSAVARTSISPVAISGLC